jgi:putative Mg2+ transporter-C (MgtC) family protein
MAAALALLSLIFLKRLEPIINKDRYLDIVVTATNRPGLQDELEKLFVERAMQITDIRSHVDLQHNEITFEYVLTQHRRRMGRELSGLIEELEGVHKIRYH